ncbi:MAG TPA: glycosyl hydrolase family 5, partial [Terriglobia bacterium]|nr:glycosyl hydrolase family 5 [Terriglobia bacterium]
AALYIQFARAIHKLVPQARLGGPPFEGTSGDVDSWADANGRVSFLGRFVDYLKAHDDLQDFTFFSFEHYPCMGTGKCRDWTSLYYEPEWVDHVVQAWKDNGLPPNIPFFMTEGNDLGEGSPGTVKSGLWLADYVGAMMTAGAGGTYYFHYIAQPGRGGRGFLSVDEENHPTYSPQYLATQVITQDWVQPVDKIHKLYRATSDVKDDSGNILVTAYPVERPDGNWSVMLINKDENNDHDIKVSFTDGATKESRYFTGTVDRVVFGPNEYQWHPDQTPVTTSIASASISSDAPQEDGEGAGRGRGRGGFDGHADPDGPASKSTLTAAGQDTVFVLPKASIIVLRGKIAGE